MSSLMCHVLGGRRSCECNTLDNGKPSVIVGVVFSTEPSDEVHSELIAAARRGGSAGALLADFRHEEGILKRCLFIISTVPLISKSFIF